MKDGFSISEKITIKKIKKNDDKKINIISIDENDQKTNNENRNINEDNR